MPLKLKQYVDCEDTITDPNTGIVLIVSANISEEVIYKFAELKNIDETDPKLEEFKKAIQLGKEILYAKNKQEDVDKVFKGMDFPDKIRVLTFLSEFIKGSMEQMKADQQKKS